MDVNYISQPNNSRLCGQACLAMIKNISLRESIKLIGHQRGTKSKELTKYFNTTKNKRGIPEKQGLCISRPVKEKARGNWHWVLYVDGVIYDPSAGYPISYEDFSNYFNITSHFPIL